MECTESVMRFVCGDRDYARCAIRRLVHLRRLRERVLRHCLRLSLTLDNDSDAWLSILASVCVAGDAVDHREVVVDRIRKRPQRALLVHGLTICNQTLRAECYELAEFVVVVLVLNTHLYGGLSECTLTAKITAPWCNSISDRTLTRQQLVRHSTVDLVGRISVLWIRTASDYDGAGLVVWRVGAKSARHRLAVALSDTNSEQDTHYTR